MEKESESTTLEISERLEEENVAGTSSANELPADRFSAWIHCFCVVTFDLELGQAFELMYPSTAVLSESEKTSICYLALPDSNSGCMGDTQFHFRMRASSPEGFFYHGYVLFRQIKDKQLPRGYFQKSVVVISRLPLVNFFTELVRLVALAFFASGVTQFEAAFREIALHWPSPNDDGSIRNRIELPLLGSQLQLDLGDTGRNAMDYLTFTEENNSLNFATCPAVMSDTDMYRCFALAGLLPHLHLLWELVLVGEPLVVMSTHPQTCSQLVLALVSLIAPIDYFGDFRPYFTIHDTELKEFASRSHAPPAGVILGVTNPFFAKTLHHWPHVIRAAENSASDMTATKLYRRGIRGSKKSSNGPQASSGAKNGGLYTQYKMALRPGSDVPFGAAIGSKADRLRRPESVQATMLRRFFYDLTNEFLIPLEQYLQSSMPLQKDILAFKEAPQPKPFDCADFLKALEGRRADQKGITARGDWRTLYGRFFNSVNFVRWYARKRRALVTRLQVSQLREFARADVKSWSVDKEEVEVFDMVLRIRGKIKEYGTTLVPTLTTELENRLSELEAILPSEWRDLPRGS